MPRKRTFEDAVGHNDLELLVVFLDSLPLPLRNRFSGEGDPSDISSQLPSTERNSCDMMNKRDGTDG